MATRPAASGSISFGLVSIPVKLFTATVPRTVNFNLLHKTDLSRIQQKIYCPVDDKIIDRSELIRGFQYEKNKYVTFDDLELQAMEAANDHAIDIAEFLPMAEVDPLYFESSYYLSPDENAGKAYRLLAVSMAQSERVALGRFTMHGKEHVIMIRPFEDGLLLHTIYYNDEVRPMIEVDKFHGSLSNVELDLAKKLIDELTHKKFDLSNYHDSYRERVMTAVQQKIAGQGPAPVKVVPKRGQVIDIMEALKASLQKERLKDQIEATPKRRRSAK